MPFVNSWYYFLSNLEYFSESSSHVYIFKCSPYVSLQQFQSLKGW
jgi:hypothetical protein